jgi:hypothetical protein
MNKAQLVELFKSYEQSLVTGARNKNAERAFISGLYAYYGKTRPNTSNDLRPATKKNEAEFAKNIKSLVSILGQNSPNAKALANANKVARQAILNFYFDPQTITRAIKVANNVKAARAARAPKAPNVPAPAPKAPVNVNALFKSLVTEAAKVRPQRNRLGRPLGSRKYPPGYMQNFTLPNGLTMNNFKNKLNRLDIKWTSEQNLKRMVEATLLRKYGPKNSSFYAKYPNFATGPFRNILNRATNLKKRFQPSLTASNAQFQILKALSPNGKTYYGNLPVLRTLKSNEVNRFANLTPIQKNALKRIILSVRLNNMEPNKKQVRYGNNRMEITNNFMQIKLPNKNLLNVLKKRVAKRRAPTQWLTNNMAPKSRGPAAAPAAAPAGALTSIFGSRTTSTNWRNFNK